MARGGVFKCGVHSAGGVRQCLTSHENENANGCAYVAGRTGSAWIKGSIWGSDGIPASTLGMCDCVIAQAGNIIIVSDR